MNIPEALGIGLGLFLFILILALSFHLWTEFRSRVIAIIKNVNGCRGHSNIVPECPRPAIQSISLFSAGHSGWHFFKQFNGIHDHSVLQEAAPDSLGGQRVPKELPVCCFNDIRGLCNRSCGVSFPSLNIEKEAGA